MCAVQADALGSCHTPASMKDSSQYPRLPASIRALWMAVALLPIGCSTSSSLAPEGHEGPALDASAAGSAAALAAPHPCCIGNQEVQRLDGQRVAIVGHYTPVHLAKRIGKADGGGAGPPMASTVALETSYGLTFMLEIYYNPSGVRPVEEIARFEGKRVEIVGVLHARTPSQRSDDGEVQTMVGPYLGEIESVREAP
jgi:hypothetical protein